MARASLRGETSCHFLADANLGPTVARVIALSGMNQQEAAIAMGYADQSVVGKWIAGTEAPNLARMWAVEELRGPLVLALAEASHTIEVETTMRLRRVTA